MRIAYRLSRFVKISRVAVVKKLVALIGACVLLGPAAASAAAIVRVGAPTARIASLVLVPAGSDIAYVSGATPGGGGSRPVGTEAQTMDVLTKISNLLKAQGMTMGDVVVMRVFLGVDPDKGGRADRDGMNAAFAKFFGTPDQPNKPARTTIAVVDMNPGQFVEIDAEAARAPK
jgi:enamine deaminase RidA (YjgF/YER057c/UK114 family)